MRVQESRGVAYVTVLLMVLMITVSGLAFLRTSEREMGLAGEEERTAQALLAAEAGVRRVMWALRRVPMLQPSGPTYNYNPFNQRWYADPGRPLPDTDLMGVVNPGAAEAFHPSSMASYYWISQVTGSGTKVRVEVLGSVDADRDGQGGLGDRDGDGSPDVADADPQDNNRFLEVFLGLPGAMGQDVSLAAQDIVDGNGNPLTLAWPGPAATFQKGLTVAGFWYEGGGATGPYNTVLSKPILRSGSSNADFPAGTPVQLPPGMFREDGTPEYSYFAEFVKQPPYEGNQTFSSTVDPTSGAAQGTIIWVNGDATIQNVDLGTVTTLGDWTRQDVAIVATGRITVSSVSCNWPGRLVLVAKDVELKDQWGKWLNGLIVAGNNIDLRNSTLQQVSLASPPIVASYFFGSMVARGRVVIHDPGWAIIFDPWVVNGIMGHNPLTQVLDRFEGEDPLPCWSQVGSVTEVRQGLYLQDERTHRAGDATDLGGDSVPQLLRMTVRPTDTDGGIGEAARLVVDGSQGVGCTPIREDWGGFNEVRFYTVVDNFRSDPVSVGPGISMTTEKRATYQLVLADNAGRELAIDLAYPQSRWGKAGYRVGADVEDPHPSDDDYESGYLPYWHRMILPISALQPVAGGPAGAFDWAHVQGLRFQLKELVSIWRCEGGPNPLTRELRAETGALQFSAEGGPSREVRTRLVDGIEILEYEDPSETWNPVPWGPGGDCPEVTPPVGPKNMESTLRVDRLILPGAAMLDHGLPPGIPMEVSQWRELTADEASR